MGGGHGAGIVVLCSGVSVGIYFSVDAIARSKQTDCPRARDGLFRSGHGGLLGVCFH